MSMRIGKSSESVGFADRMQQMIDTPAKLEPPKRTEEKKGSFSFGKLFGISKHNEKRSGKELWEFARSKKLEIIDLKRYLLLTRQEDDHFKEIFRGQEESKGFFLRLSISPESKRAWILKVIRSLTLIVNFTVIPVM